MSRPLNCLRRCDLCGIRKVGCVFFKTAGRYACKDCAPALRRRATTHFGMMGLLGIMGVPRNTIERLTSEAFVKKPAQ